MTESQRRTLRIVRWPLLFVVVGGLIAWWAFVSAGGCAPGPPEFKASDLIQATVKNLYPAGGGVPVVTTIDLGKTGDLDKLLAAYQSMKPANETGRITAPDLYLDLKLKGDREIVVVLEKDTPQFVEIREYRGGELRRTIHLRPGAMFDYLAAKS
jgi:hypothetical protein